MYSQKKPQTKLIVQRIKKKKKEKKNPWQIKVAEFSYASDRVAWRTLVKAYLAVGLTEAPINMMMMI